MFNRQTRHRFVAIFLFIAILISGVSQAVLAQQRQNLPIIKAIVIRGTENVDTALVQQPLPRLKLMIIS